ncbi:FUSC family protein [Nonomuraea monospora]|uniref:FUSC family protein n=2 Tax=Nonomuraea monospora TaxID=568818 RepID=A0ABN3CVY2_9ACTN
MPVRAALRLAPLGDIWHKPALSGVAALAVVLVTLLLAGRLDLTLYASAGAMCALYGHGLPYAARAKALGWVVAGMLAGTTVALVTAALTESVAVRVAVAAVLAGVHKAACDASRIGPPGNVVLTFVAASAAFVPGERLADVPVHVGLGVLGGVVAWVVGMAPGVVRPDGPERVAVARALEATARLVRAGGCSAGDEDARQARHAAATAVNAAWQTLLRSGDRREGLRRLLVRAESAAAACAGGRVLDECAPGGRVPGGRVRGGADAGTLAGWAHELRKGRPVPEPPICDARTEAAERAELSGIAAERDAATAGAAARWAFLARWWRVVATVAAGAALAGWVSMALGVGRPYWAVVTAAAVFAANTTMSWSRALQRVLGNLLGVALFTALVPLTRWGAVALIVAVLVMQFVTEAAITRNYWLGSVFVAPMAMLMTEFAGAEPVSALVADRWLDTCLGAAAGLLACVLLPDRRAADRVRDGLERLRGALVELREAADLAAGEWWSAALPQERIAAAERAGHHRLAELTA